MAYQEKKGAAIPALTKDPRLDQYKREYDRWHQVLNTYHVGRFDRNWRLFTAYTQAKGTDARISDPMAPELTERVIQKLFERDPSFLAMARGKNLPKELIDLMQGVASYLWTNPEIVQTSGPMRPKLKVVAREFMVTGNAGTEVYFDSRANNPNFRLIPIEDVVFEPTKTPKTSRVHYIRQFLSWKDLEDLTEIAEDGRVVSGIFKGEAIKRLKAKFGPKDETGLRDDPSGQPINRAGSTSHEHPKDKILLTSRYEGKKVCRIAEWEEILQETEDPLQIGDDPLDFAMDIEVPKEPYAFSFLDFINGLAQAKDLLLNQVVDYGSKLLNPPLFADPSIGTINRQTLRNAYKTGGIIFANPQQVDHKMMPPLPGEGFNLLGYLQQRAESTSGIGAYLGGVPNQTSDRTRGTKGGIEALISQSVSPVKDRQQNLEESIVEPIVNKWLKMVGALMGQNEEKYVFISGQSPKWVKLTRGILTGKITLPDLLVAELMTPEEGTEMAQILLSEGKDPERELLFDVDWIIRVETGSMAAEDTQESIQSLLQWADFNQRFGVPQKIMEISKELAARSGLKEPDKYLEAAPVGPGAMPGAANMPPGIPQGTPAPAIPPGA